MRAFPLMVSDCWTPLHVHHRTTKWCARQGKITDALKWCTCLNAYCVIGKSWIYTLTGRSNVLWVGRMSSLIPLSIRQTLVDCGRLSNRVYKRVLSPQSSDVVRADVRQHVVLHVSKEASVFSPRLLNPHLLRKRIDLTSKLELEHALAA